MKNNGPHGNTLTQPLFLDKLTSGLLIVLIQLKD